MLTATIENVLNRGLPRSPRAQQLCAELTGRSVAVEVREITRLLAGIDRQYVANHPRRCRRGCGNRRRSLRSVGLERRASRSRGPDAAMWRFAAMPSWPRNSASWCCLLRPDLEEELSGFVGDVPAHQIGRFARMALGWTTEPRDHGREHRRILRSRTPAIWSPEMRASNSCAVSMPCVKTSIGSRHVSIS